MIVGHNAVVFERFTDRARRVVVLAQEEARLLNHNFIGTEHLLLGLLSEGEGLAAQTLESLSVDLHAARSRVEEIIGRGNGSPGGHIPFTPRTKKVLEMSLREAIRLGHSYIGTEHLLLGLLREGQGVGAQVLVQMGADLKRARQQIVSVIGSGASQEIEDDPTDVGATGNPDLVIESLAGEVRRLRREVDRLRAELRRAEPGPAPFRPASLPGTDVPPTTSTQATGPPVVSPEAAPSRSGELPAESGTYRSVLSCSFCSEPQERVTKLIAGPGVYICDRCIALCQEILDEELGPPEAEPPSDDPA